MPDISLSTSNTTSNTAYGSTDIRTSEDSLNDETGEKDPVRLQLKFCLIFLGKELKSLDGELWNSLTERIQLATISPTLKYIANEIDGA
jgi:hypothetical protein